MVPLIFLAVLAAGASGLPVEPTDALAARAVTAASNVFGADLYEELRGAAGNLVVSPLSASAALAMTLQGARNRTAQQLARALHVSDDASEVARGYAALMARKKGNEEVRLSIANKVYAEASFGVKEAFRQTAERSFRAGAEAVHFQNDTEGARVAINDWIKQATEGFIPEIYEKGALDPATLMVIVNTIYFKGNWATPFREENTKPMPFHLSATSKVDVPTMRDIIRADTVDLPQFNATVLQLLYNDQTTRLLIFLPDEVGGLEQLENNIRNINLHGLEFDPTVMEVLLPKFKISTNLRLQKTLMKLGVEDLFMREKANLTGISDLEGLFVSKVLHKAVIEVTEKGTEAAAATAVELTNKFVPDFQVNRPFVFMLVDVDQTVLFMGRVTNPLEQ